MVLPPIFEERISLHQIIDQPALERLSYLIRYLMLSRYPRGRRSKGSCSSLLCPTDTEWARRLSSYQLSYSAHDVSAATLTSLATLATLTSLSRVASETDFDQNSAGSPEYVFSGNIQIVDHFLVADNVSLFECLDGVS